MENSAQNTRNAVLFTCDKKYLPYAITAIERIRAIDLNPTYDICICSDDLTGDEFPFDDLDIRLEHTSTSPFETLNIEWNMPAVTFDRLVAPKTLLGRYDRILYCDSDTYLLNGGLQHLFDMDMQGHAIAAAPDRIMWYPNAAKRFKKYREGLGLSEKVYFNSGVLLIDVNKFAEEQLLERCIKFAHENPEKIHIMDQSVLNGVLQGDFLQLSIRWNWQNCGMVGSLVEQYQPYILHFNSSTPWFPANDTWFRGLYDEYNMLVSKNFADVAEQNSRNTVRKGRYRHWLEDTYRLSTLKPTIVKLEQTSAG